MEKLIIDERLVSDLTNGIRIVVKGREIKLAPANAIYFRDDEGKNRLLRMNLTGDDGKDYYYGPNTLEEEARYISSRMYNHANKSKSERIFALFSIQNSMLEGLLRQFNGEKCLAYEQECDTLKTRFQAICNLIVNEPESAPDAAEPAKEIVKTPQIIQNLIDAGKLNMNPINRKWKTIGTLPDFISWCIEQNYGDIVNVDFIQEYIVMDVQRATIQRYIKDAKDVLGK
jgi:hypothetical protein